MNEINAQKKRQMTHKKNRVSDEFLKDLSLKKRLELLDYYPEHKDEIIRFINENSMDKPYLQFEKSLEGIPKDLSETEIKRIKDARTCALNIVCALLNFDDVNNLQNIRTRIEHELRVAEGFKKPILPEGEWKDSENPPVPELKGLRKKIERSTRNMTP